MDWAAEPTDFDPSSLEQTGLRGFSPRVPWRQSRLQYPDGATWHEQSTSFARSIVALARAMSPAGWSPIAWVQGPTEGDFLLAALSALLSGGVPRMRLPALVNVMAGPGYLHHWFGFADDDGALDRVMPAIVPGWVNVHLAVARDERVMTLLDSLPCSLERGAIPDSCRLFIDCNNDLNFGTAFFPADLEPEFLHAAGEAE